MPQTPGRSRSTSYIRAVRKLPKKKPQPNLEKLDIAIRNIATLAEKKETGIDKPIQRRSKIRCANNWRKEAARILGIEECAVSDLARRCGRLEDLETVGKFVISTLHLDEGEGETMVA